MKPHWRIRGKQISLIHVGKKDLMAKGVLTEESYRDCLARFGDGAKHANELNQAQMDALLAHFKQCGFVYIAKVKKAPEVRRQQRAKQIYLEAIQATLGALGKDWAYADGIAKKMFGVDKAEWLSPEQLHDLQTALIYHERRLAGEPPQPRPETVAKRRRRSRERSAGRNAGATEEEGR